MKSLYCVAAIATIGMPLLSALTVMNIHVVLADPHPEDHVKEGNNGQCWKLQKELNLGGTKDECRDSFTGKDHHDDNGGNGNNDDDDDDDGDGDVDPELPP
jgi:hypothetical protein